VAEKLSGDISRAACNANWVVVRDVHASNYSRVQRHWKIMQPSRGADGGVDSLVDRVRSPDVYARVVSRHSARRLINVLLNILIDMKRFIIS